MEDTNSNTRTSPFHEIIGIEITEVEPDRAKGRLELTETVSSNQSHLVVDPGAIASLANSVGSMAASTENDFSTTTTSDLRLDHLTPATSDLIATATVIRNNSNVCIVDIEVESADDIVAVARGSFNIDESSNNSGER